MKDKQHVVGIAGEIASGTTTAAEYAKEKYGAATHRFSIPLQDVACILSASLKETEALKKTIERLYLPENENKQQLREALVAVFDRQYRECITPDSREVLQKLSTLLRQTFGEDLLGNAVVEDIKRFDNTCVVVEGIRRPRDISNLCALPHFSFLYIDASFETRWERFQKRAQYADEQKMTRDVFGAICNQESERQIRGLIHYDAYADNKSMLVVNIIENDHKSLARFKKELKGFFENQVFGFQI